MNKLCKFCGKKFADDSNSNRKPKEYCSIKCRRYFHQFNFLSRIKNQVKTQS